MSLMSGPPLYRYIPGVGKVSAAITGPTGPQGSQGAPGTASGTGATGMTGSTGPAGFQGYTGVNGSVLFYNNGVTGRADFGLTGSTLQIPGNLIPTMTNTYSLGATGARWKEVLVGPGTINIEGPPGFAGSATIGTDSAGLVYTESGMATPKIVIGPAQLTPSAVGGWQIGPTGVQGIPGYALVAQELQTNGSGPTGPVYQLAPNSIGGSTGSTGPASTVTGPTGVAGPTGESGLIPSTFVTTTIGVTLATGPTGTRLNSTTITTTQTGYVWAMADVQLINTANTTDHEVTLYMMVDGYKSDGPTVTLPRKVLNGTNVCVTLSSRSSNKVGPGIWPIETYAYTTSSTTNVTAMHRDAFAIAHLG